MALKRIPLSIVSTLDGQVTEGVIVAVLVTDLDALEAALDAAEMRAEEAALRSIEARNPGIDMDEVRRLGNYREQVQDGGLVSGDG